MRSRDPARSDALKSAYHKGHEVRLVVASPKEARRIRRWLYEVGFKPGAPFGKHGRVVQPVYGREAVEWFERGELGSSPRPRRRAPVSRRQPPPVDPEVAKLLRALEGWREHAGSRMERVAARDDGILDAASRGASQSSIARAVGVSRQRVHQIVTARERRGDSRV